ncbi:hypothetical protein [uncultured Azonexus sp.]|uniref:hypothetical protein n=1 Tax=uncultured Azonexus sp. TaxID=520307 RepID=UPI00260D49D1|nr:hypothetical protein [uncultured Azonexus sp.]
MTDHHHATFCPAAKRPRSINERSNVPFYIYAPDYRDSSGGIRVLHYLCHILNEMGEEAYLVGTQVASPRLRTPVLTLKRLEEHFLAGQTPVTLYPEVVSNNPANTPLIARWLLNVPGHLGKDIDFEPEDLIFYYEAWCLPPQMSGQPLFIHPVDESVFHNDDNPDDEARTLECYYANKYFLGQHPLLPEHEQLISLGQEVKRTPQEIASILRRSKVLYCYEPSGIISEAQACGCPVLLVRSSYMPLPEDDPHHRIPGLAIYGEPHALEKAKQSLRWTPAAHEAARDQSWARTQAMVESVYRKAEHLRTHGKPLLNETQAMWSLPLAERPAAAERFREAYAETGLCAITHQSPGLLAVSQRQSGTTKSNCRDDDYLRWLDRRDLLIAQSPLDGVCQDTGLTTFQIIIRVTSEEASGLASTLDSLAGQIHSGWHLDILTSLPEPEGLADIPCIGWHTVSNEEAFAALPRKLVTDGEYDFVIELPAGARLDPLYLWRIAKTAASNINCSAFFVDDDLYDDDGGKRSSPRLKPGINPSALIESDLAGPLCMRRTQWLATAEAHDSVSPWFDKLLAIAEQDGWDTLHHIPDILISLPKNGTDRAPSCRTAIRAHLQRRGIAADLIDSGPSSWHIRYPLERTPEITLAIISDSDFLHSSIVRCVETIHRYTRYPAFNIIICKASGDSDPELLAHIERWRGEFKTSIQLLSPAPPQTYSALCNHATQAATTEFLALLDEEVQIIQDTWLEELLRTALQPNIGAVLPCQIQPGSSLINCAGPVLGLNGLVDSPYRGRVKYGTAVALNWLQTTRDVGAIPKGGFLVNRKSYIRTGGMDEDIVLADLAMADLGLKLRRQGDRLIYQPLSNIVYQAPTAGALPEPQEALARKQLKQFRSRDIFIERWRSKASIDPFWNPNLSLAGRIPGLETSHLPPWHVVPNQQLRILARPVTNGQGYYRVTAPLDALHAEGKIQRCIWDQSNFRPATPAELIRLAPDVLVVQNYLGDSCLHELRETRNITPRPFVIQTLDDLMSGLAASNPLRATIPPNPAERIQHSLAHCDRLIVSTDYLAEHHNHHVKDIKVVPNRLEQALWLPLSSQKRTGKKPRIGWAGGTTHQDDLLLLEEIITATRDDADWIFMGMCPESIRPLLSEYHPMVGLADYPAYLASLNFDIAVAPLAETPFNRAKSNLRLLEYGILGIPVVCTDIAPYRNSPACRVKNTPAAWIQALQERIHDPDAREREGRVMREWVLRAYILEDHLDEWLMAHRPN